MEISERKSSAPPGAEDETAFREIVGYLNFSRGSPDAKFQRNLNHLAGHLAAGDEGSGFAGRLQERVRALEAGGGPFADCSQAAAVIPLVFENVLPAYRRHHADLLAHVEPLWFFQPLFVARVFEAVLAQGGPWTESDRIVSGALGQLNDYLGHRPVAVLENRRRMQPYDRERFRPVPLFLKNVGVSAGPYQSLIAKALEILQSIPHDVLAASYFDFERLDELALDLRAYDNSHPVFRRTNYTFGEWDPHCIDVSGRYRRFIVRGIILEALSDWMKHATDIPPEEQVSEAAAVLAGTMLMAASISGAGPDTHDSSVSLTSLLPRVARQRDAFYQLLLQTMSGKHAERLRREAQVVQQPFGKIRQHLNLFLANYGCQQLQRSQLSWLYARMGYADAARRQARIIPAASTRFETEIQLQLTQALLEAECGTVAQGAEALIRAEELLHRGIECGALVDPWNILGFQGQFPLFSAREDSVPDPRVDRLLALMDQLFNSFSRVECEAAAQGDSAVVTALQQRFTALAEFWDKFAAVTIADLQQVYGGISCESARRVSRVLLAWRDAGEAAGDLGFWRKHVEELDSPRAYATVIDLLLRKRDVVAAMNLLIQWLSQSDVVPLEAGASSFWPLLDAWVHLVISQADSAPPGDPSAEKSWNTLRKFFDYVEANAGEWGQAPRIQSGAGEALKLAGGLPPTERPPGEPAEEPFDPFELPGDEPDVDELFSAAYENVVFRDSAQDGHTGDTVDEGPAHIETDLDRLVGPLEQRLRFLVTLSQGWRTVAAWTLAGGAGADDPARESRQAVVRHWEERNAALIRDLVRLLESLAEWNPQDPQGDPDSLGEYDRELHVKFSLLNNAIAVVATLQEVARSLRCLTRQPATDKEATSGVEERVQQLLALIEARNVGRVQKMLPGVLRQLSRLPLLYVPLDRGGKVREILASRNLQGLLRLLLKKLPELGLLRESWHVLRTAFVMERSNPPTGMSITEFDRLLETAVQSTLQVALKASESWKPAETSDKKLVELFGALVEPYLRLWLKHSDTMRLCTIESMADRELWREVKEFVKSYGADLFHPRMLSMGNLRGIVQRGADAYLDYLAENNDPLHPIRLLEDIDYTISREEAAETLELILRSVVEKFDRFLEYNSTTTHSDYGEQLHCLLDFQRLEAEYDRQDWNLAPLQLAHDVLARAGRVEMSRIWQKNLEKKTASVAKGCLQKLKRLEKIYGMRLPSVTDRLNERFTKPLVLDSILALVRPAMVEMRTRAPQASFPRLEELAEQYLSTTSGSAMDVQPWMQRLGEEVQVVENALNVAVPWDPNPPSAPVVEISPAAIRQQLDIWEQPLK